MYKYICFQDPTTTREEVGVKAVNGNPELPLIWLGSLCSSQDWFLVCEGIIVHMGSSSLVKAIKHLMATYYISEIEYPKKAKNTFSYIQIELLGLDIMF